MRRIFLPLLMLAPAALAQTAPSPDAVPMGDKAGAPTGAGPTSKETPADADPGMPSDVHTTPPPVTSQAPPPTSGDTAPTDTKSKGRAKPSSTAKQRPQG